MTMKNTLGETVLVQACLELLALRRIPAWRANTGAARMPSGRFVRFGTPGISDILGVLPPAGRLLAVECKRAGNKPTPEQQLFLDAVTAAGGLALVVRDVTELQAALER